MYSKEQYTLPPKVGLTAEKTCFILMPDNQVGEYEIGHFKRVFEYLIKPACHLAGYNTRVIKGEEIHSQPLRLKQVSELIEADLVICDLSTQHPQFLYLLGIRQALHLPVILLKGKKKPAVFDAYEWRHIDYDENLRVDSIENKVLEIANLIKATTGAANKKELEWMKPENGGVLPKIPNIPPDISFLMDSIQLLNQRLQSVETKINASKTKLENGAPILSAAENYSFIIRNK